MDSQQTQHAAEVQDDGDALDTKPSLDTATQPALTSPVPTKQQNNNTPNPQSKNQQKKRARYEKALAAKKRRKEQEREVRALKAKHEGRDLEQEREQQRLNEQVGKGWERREQLWKQKMEDANIDNSFRVCFDCSFEDRMTWKEKNSLGLQLRYTYSRNRKSSCPVYIDVCSLKKGDETRGHLEKVAGFPESWVSRAFNTYEAGIEEVYKCGSSKKLAENKEGDPNADENETDQKLATDEPSQTAAAETHSKPGQKLIYLTGDSPNTITTLENDTTYIIGGIVDRNRLKRAAINRAESLGIPTARLPLDENLDFKGSTRVLTCNHVFEILLKYRENGYDDWKGAILSVLPGRKEVQEKAENDESLAKCSLPIVECHDDEDDA